MISSHKQILASPLSIGDTIGFFSASSPITANAPNRFERAKEFITSKGYSLQAGSLTRKSDYYRSGTIAERAEELNTLIRDPNVRCIMSTIGGTNSNSLLPWLDYEALVRDPKIIIGYSDTTALLLGIYAKTGLITFYGPALVASFGEFPPLVETTYNSFASILTHSQTENYVYDLPDKWSDECINWDDAKPIRAKKLYQNNCRFIGSGTIEGRVIGGNLNTLSGIWGSEWMPSIQRGDILLIEDSRKSIATVERAFSMLKLNGVFDKVSAIILGKHELFDDSGSGRRPIDVLSEVLGQQSIPIIDGFDCCHTHPMLTLPLGAQIQIDFNQEKVSIISQYLSHSAA